MRGGPPPALVEFRKDKDQQPKGVAFRSPRLWPPRIDCSCVRFTDAIFHWPATGAVRPFTFHPSADV